MVPQRPRYAIGGRSRGPLFGLFPRHPWYGQRENGTPPDTCERFLVGGAGTPNVHQVASAQEQVTILLPIASEPWRARLARRV